MLDMQGVDSTFYLEAFSLNLEKAFNHNFEMRVVMVAQEEELRTRNLTDNGLDLAVFFHSFTPLLRTSNLYLYSAPNLEPRLRTLHWL